MVLSSGVLGDALENWLQQQVFEPTMQLSNVWQFLFVSLFGTGAGARYTLFYVGCALVKPLLWSIAMLLVGMVSFRVPQLHLLGKTEAV